MATNTGTLLQALQPWAPVIAASMAAAVAVIFGVIQASISRQQAKTAEAAAKIAGNKLKLELLDRRLAIYDSVKQSASAIAIMGPKGDDAAVNYFRSISSARWLFGDEVLSYLRQEIGRSISDYRIEVDTLLNAESDEEKAEASAKTQAIRNQFFSALDRLDDVFAPYLTLST